MFPHCLQSLEDQLSSIKNHSLALVDNLCCKDGRRLLLAGDLHAQPSVQGTAHTESRVVPVIPFLVSERVIFLLFIADFSGHLRRIAQDLTTLQAQAQPSRTSSGSHLSTVISVSVTQL